MTRQNGIHIETTEVEAENKRFSISEMWCENSDVLVLGNPLHVGYESDNIQEQYKHTCGSGLVDGT
jgi:hypothetical protein